MAADAFVLRMLPHKTDECNWNFKLPTRPGDLGMPCIADFEQKITTTFFIPEDEIPPTNSDDVFGIHVVTVGFLTKIEVAFSTTVEHGEFTELPMQMYMFPSRPGGKEYWASVAINDWTRDYLNGNGLFIVRNHMCPPCPISVWIS